MVCVHNILIETGFDCVWDSQSFASVNRLCRNVRLSLEDNYKRTWSDALESSNKCLIYRNYKTDFGRERYIETLPDVYIFPLIRFRCGNHKLMIEVGRHFGIPHEDRICRDCDLNDLGDEFHFVMKCPKYDDIRRQFIPRRFSSVKSVFNYCRLLCGSKKVLLNLAKFLKFNKVV